MTLFTRKLSAGSSLKSMAAMVTPRSVLSFSALALGAFIALPLMFGGSPAVANDANACYGSSIVMAANTEAATTLLRTGQFEYGQAYGATFVTARVMTMDANGNLVELPAGQSAAVLNLVTSLLGADLFSTTNIVEANAGTTTPFISNGGQMDAAALLQVLAALSDHDFQVGGQDAQLMTVGQFGAAIDESQIWTAQLGSSYVGGALDEAGLAALLHQTGLVVDGQDGTLRINE